MFPRPRIIAFHVDDLAVTVDWGWARSRAEVPSALLDDPFMPKKTLLELIAPLEPPRWVPHLTSAIWPQSFEEEPIDDDLKYWRDSLEVEAIHLKEVLNREKLLFNVKAVIFGEGSHPLFKAAFRYCDVDCRQNDTTHFWSEQLGLSDDEIDKLYSEALRLDKQRAIRIG